MKRILITGANSYIGTNVEKYLGNWPESYQIETLNMLGDEWREKSFLGYDVILHVAGIAHIKETKKNTELYYNVNEALAVETAVKAKEEGVKQFIILSTMNVYGVTTGCITKNTKPEPVMNYGKAKYNADLKLESMDCGTFKVAILRPPMVYGKDCKGNYQTLRKFALKSPVFPNYKNRRSMVYVGNLTAFIRDVIDGEKRGVYFPQDGEYICTADMVKEIALCNGKKIIFTKMFNWVIDLMLKLNVNVFKKVFGTLVYEKVDIKKEYNFEDAIRKTEADC